MNITRYALNNRQVSLLLLFIICFAGIRSYLDISRAKDPGFKVRTAQIITQFPGASPERVEMLVSDKIEKKVQELPELDSVTSQSRAGISIVNVNIKDSYQTLRPIWDKLRRKIDELKDELPDDAHMPEVNDDFGDVYGIIVSIITDGFSYAELRETADVLRDELLRLPMTAKVKIYGVQKEQIFIEYNNSRLAELGLSPSYISNFLQNKNIIQSGGELITRDEVIAIEPSGDIESIEALKSTYIPLPGKRAVLPLGDIATIYRSYIDPPRSIVHTNGQPALALAIAMIEEGNIISLGEQVKTLLQKMDSEFPWGYQFEVAFFQPDMVTKTIDSFVSNLLQAIAVVTFTMLISLGLRTGLVVASLIPVTMLASIMVMASFSIGLDQVSLAALMIALGMLVDNAIVMAENMVSQMEDGNSAFEAAINSAAELKIPLLTSSLTTSAAFLPIFLAESTTGEYTAPIFKVVTIALLLSWLLAITLIPLLGFLFLRVKKRESASVSSFKVIEYSYARILHGILQHRILFVIAIIGIFSGAIASFRFVPNIFFPPSEDPVLKIELELPMGSPISKTNAVVNSIERYMSELKQHDPDGIANWIAYVGNGGPRYILSHSSKPAAPNYAFMLINTHSHHKVSKLIEQLDTHIFDNYPGVNASVKKLPTGSPVNHPIEVRILGKDKALLLDIRRTVMEKLASIEGLKNISDDWGLQTKKIFVNVDEAKANASGVSNSDIAGALRASMNGIKIAEFREGDQILPIIIKSESVTYNGVPLPSSINVFSQTGSNVPMSQVTDIELEWESPVIFRRDRLKTLSITADLNEGKTAAEINKVLSKWLNQRSAEWPPGYQWEFGGEAESSGKANASIGKKLPIAIVIILLLLMFQFNSFRKVAIIFLTIPLALIGVVAGLLIADSYMGFMTLLGIISLAGIVINNAIVLIDRIQVEQDASGKNAYEAIIAAGVRRLRPILLTTATTVLGMLPLWLGGGAMWEPMAISIIFGLLGSTLLTLGVVPVLYSILFNVKKSP